MTSQHRPRNIKPHAARPSTRTPSTPFLLVIAGEEAKENEHADMDSKELRAFVGEPIDDISDDWTGGTWPRGRRRPLTTSATGGHE